MKRLGAGSATSFQRAEAFALAQIDRQHEWRPTHEVLGWTLDVEEPASLDDPDASVTAPSCDRLVPADLRWPAWIRTKTN